MSRQKKLVFDLNALSEEGRAYLRNGFCIDENPNHLWCSENALLDHIYDGGRGPNLEAVPEEVWATLGLSTEDRAEIEAHWADDPDNEIEFEL